MKKLGIAFCFDHPTLMAQLKLRNAIHKATIEFFVDQTSLLSAWRNNDLFDRIVISAEKLHVTELSDVVEQLHDREITKLVVLLPDEKSSNNDSIMRYCLAQNLDYLPLEQDVTDVAFQLFNLLIDDKQTERRDSNHIVTFAGTTPNVGTTVVAYTTALLLAQQTTQSIAYVCLNLKSSKIHSYLGIDQPAITLDSFRADIKSRALTADKIKAYSITSKSADNLSIFVGNMAREQAELYSVDDIQHVLDTVASAYDLCIVDVNAYWDNAATIRGLMCADSRIMVSTDQLSHFQEDTARWLKNSAPVYRMDVSSFDLFITQYESGKQSSGISFKHIRRETGMNIVGKLHKVERLNELLNQGIIEEILAHDSQVSKDLSGLITMLTTLYQLDKKHLKSKQRWPVWQPFIKGGS